MFKIGGSTLVWVVALGAGLMLARSWLRQQFTTMLADTDKYSVFPGSEPVITNFDVTMTEPIFTEGYFGGSGN